MTSGMASRREDVISAQPCCHLESAVACPAVRGSCHFPRRPVAYDQLIAAGDVDYRVLSDMVAEASGKGVLRTIRQKHGATVHEAIFGPILRDIDRQKPVPSRRSAPDRQDVPDPLTAASW
jgi:hypothetical protein